MRLAGVASQCSVGVPRSMRSMLVHRPTRGNGNGKKERKKGWGGGERDGEKVARRVTWHLMRDFASETRRIWRPPLMGLEAGSLAPLLGDEITTSRSDAFDGYRLPFSGRP